jgi:murein DD-endopeptidase MepM/ murein hydrolase activator NlpD
MTFPNIRNNNRGRLGTLANQARFTMARRPFTVAGAVLALGLALGFGAHAGYGMLDRTSPASHEAELAAVRADAQREVNALAARLGELQAQATRLNALGERLTQVGQLQDGEFDFDQPVDVGGAGPVRDMAPGQLRSDLDRLERQFVASNQQLTVLESLLFSRELDRNAVPSRDPIANSYITSNFGGRADPIRGGHQFHKGIDFEADVGDPVLSVADGVVSFAGPRAGYGITVEVDHGNGYVTRYAHNSRLAARVGDLVRSGQQIAKAGSTGRSTGAHVHFEVWENGRVVNPRQFLGTQRG